MMPSFSAIGKALGATADQMQLTIMAITIGYAVGLLVAGPLSDQFGRRKPLLAALGIHAGATVVLATSTTFQLFAAMRFIQGVAASAATVLAIAVVRDLYSGNAMLKFLAPMNAVMAIGPIGAPLRVLARCSPDSCTCLATATMLASRSSRSWFPSHCLAT